VLLASARRPEPNATSRDRSVVCEEIEDEPYPMTSHRTERPPLAALSLHDPNDITGIDQAA